MKVQRLGGGDLQPPKLEEARKDPPCGLQREPSPVTPRFLPSSHGESNSYCVF